jgi:Ran GTPase-activating protein (RanGAP) involved in mRNA processing and transport
MAACATIHSADLHGNPLEQQASFALELLLTRTQTLSALVLDACRLGPGGMTGLARGLASNTSLRTLSAINNGGGLEAAAALAQALPHNNSLQELFLSYNHFGDTGLELLCESLASNQGVAVLRVADNNAGERALLALAAALAVNHSLVSLDVSGNAAVSLAACAALGRSLALNTRLERIVCRVARIGAPQMSALVDGMLKCGVRRNRSLRGLNLAGNDLGAEGAEALARLLCNDRVDLECIDLSGNEVGDAGMLHLSKGLEYNTRLLRLRLCNNSIGPVGAARLGQALACCQTTSMLEMLDLSGNMLSDEGVIRLCEGLRNNRHLKKLSLANNAVGPQGAGALVGLLTASLNLQHLSLEENPLDVAGVVTLTSGLRANRGLHHLNIQHVSGDNTDMEELQLAFSRLGRSNQAVFVERSQTCG